MRRLLIFASWAVLAALSSGVAWAVLSTADREVGAGPASPVLTVALSSTTLAGGPSTTTSADPVTSTSTPTSSSTSTSPDKTTSVPPATDWELSTIPSGGGTVVVAHRPGEVRLESATPRPGFAMEIDDRGSGEVRVEFESDDESYRVRVRWDNGSLRIDISD